MIGYLKNGIYVNAYGTKISCFACDSNECVGSKSFSLKFGGNGELLYCAHHEQAAKTEADIRSGNVTISNMNTSCS